MTQTQMEEFFNAAEEQQLFHLHPFHNHQSTDDDDHDDHVKDDDMVTLEDFEIFQREIAARSNRPSPIAIQLPPARRRPRYYHRHSPLPLSGLHALDQHAWNTQPDLLAKWARGAGIGYRSNSVTECMFTPGSPPQMKTQTKTTKPTNKS